MNQPAYLFIGPRTVVLDQVKARLKTILCEQQKACGICGSCNLIQTQQHPQVRFLTPDGQYTTVQLEPMFHILSYALDQGEQFFFVLEQADQMHTVVANSLLKTLEEPPQGYHFFLLASRRDYIIPTILSRCVIETIPYDQQKKMVQHPLMKFFIQPLGFDAGTTLLKETEKLGLTENDMPDLLDALFLYWQEQLKKGNDHALFMLGQLERSMKTLPAPGGLKLFLKNLCLAIHFS